MYLKALEIQGFKSFPDKTLLNFSEDVTAIVGPNGSGKSNISDAIRWVLGEQSAKGLRGAKMEDVIFGGTEHRNPVGFAQVTLVLDNTERIVPAMEETEVSVTRRYYRSGESEYFINRQAVRLRDVTDLFLDTGLGREGYSIIGQGKIDEILSTRSQERREIFEEAAGISRFRHRKEESQRKLERTEENLVRINDKIAELELQVEPLRKQSETARKFLLLRDELRILEISLWLENLEEQKRAARILETDLRNAQSERDQARAALDALFAEGEQFGQKMQALDIAAEQSRREAAGLESQTKDREAQAAVLESDIAHHQENIRRAQAELVESDRRAGGLAAQASEQNALAASMDSRLAELNADLDVLLQRAREAAGQAGGRQSEAEALRGREAIAVAAAADAKAIAAAAEAERVQLLQRREAAFQEARSTRAQLADARRALEENRQALEQAQTQAGEAANVIAGYHLRAEERARKAEEAAGKRVKLTVDAGNLEGRIRMLEEMERDYEGYSKAVKLVCQSGSSRIHGPVANLMRTDSQYALAIETALGAGLQNIVVEQEEDAKAAIRLLKQRNAGRATFLPLTAIRGTEMNLRDVEDEPGFIGLASRLVRYQERYQDIFRYLLGRTVIVEDLDCGIALARRCRYSFRIVTLDGQVMNRGGSMTGGSASRTAGVLSRAAELESLREKSAALNAQLTSAKRAEDALQRELTMARYDLETAESQRRQAEDEVLRLEGGKRHFDSLLETLRVTAENLKGELASLEAHLTENTQRAEAASAVIAAQESLAAGLRAQAEAALHGQAELLARSNALTEEVSAKKEALSNLTAQREAALQRGADLRRLAMELTGNREEREAVLRGYEESIQAARAEIALHRDAIAGLNVQYAACREKLDALSQEKIRLEARRTAQNKASQEMNEQLLDLERSVSHLEQKLAAAGMEEKQILDRLWERYQLSHTDAQAQRIELESVSKAGRRIGELKRDISALGNPNIGAIEEFQRVNSRYTYLTSQRDDVETAKKDLTDIIDSITGEMTRIFAGQFQLLNQSFQATFAEMFGGGEARLELEDPEDILGCGIDIKAQPPGKTLKTISLLSGGEKAFVAIALYFSILKVHPTPFCVLDEIEAALDDVNVTRYARYMRQLAGKTQFIVITHRRGTMEEADVLYGVTMQERGISKILTINLNEAARELDIE